MNEKIRVGIADYKVTKSPGELITLGLGSCVGIAIYDPGRKIGGLSHIMLPDSTLFQKELKLEKFADLAIPKMIREMNGGNLATKNLVAKIAGGASMFNFPDQKITSEIGKRNIEAVKKTLKSLGIRLLAEDTGGHKGRTMVVSLDKFNVEIHSGNQPVIVL